MTGRIFRFGNLIHVIPEISLLPMRGALVLVNQVKDQIMKIITVQIFCWTIQ